MKNILIISGDPNSINSELIFKLWKKININTKRKYILYQIIIYLKNNLEN